MTLQTLLDAIQETEDIAGYNNIKPYKALKLQVGRQAFDMYAFLSNVFGFPC